MVELLDVNGSKPSLRFFVSWSSLTASSISKSRFPRGGKGVFSVLVVRLHARHVSSLNGGLKGRKRRPIEEKNRSKKLVDERIDSCGS